MKRLPLIIKLVCLVLMPYPSVSQEVKNDWLRQSLKGNVKSATVKLYSTFIRPGRNYKSYTRKNLQKLVTYTFDTYGNFEEITSYSPNGIEIEKMVYENNENNKRQIINTLVKGKLLFRDSTLYDKENNIAVVKRYNVDDSLQKIDFFTYNRNGNVVEIKRYDKRNTLLSNHTFEYDDDGEMVGVSNFYNNNDKIENYVFKFEDRDKIGNWIKRISKKNDVVFQIMERQIEYY